jgi:lipid-A-disaccharide synthase
MNSNVMILAGEASGDLHGARLVSAMAENHPELCFFGMGGKELKGVGVDVLFDSKKIAVVGIAEIITHLPDLLAARKILRTAILQNKPALVILIDFPDFNLMLGKYAKSLGIPVFYYITPQVWAWRPGRVKTIATRVDRIGVILPFEEQFFRDRGVEARYVGHPLLDSVKTNMKPGSFRRHHKIDSGKLCIGLLPGSRIKEISRLLPVLLQGAARLQKSHGETEGMVFLIPLASTISEEDLLANGLEEYGQGLDIRLIRENRHDMMASCDVAVVVSGTVTLEMALLDTPMLVIYKVSNFTYRVGRMLVNKDLKHFSLVNLIAEREVVPELLQDEVNPRRIASELASLLFDAERRNVMLDGLRDVRQRMGGAGASRKAAALALEILSNG